ncbi:MAG: hypothetical protein JNL12_01385, partial [Planctomycetes bacterium]|nr:hypothetical protein [Planctomycetota bacterium]
LQAGALAASKAGARGEAVMAAALQSLQRGEAFTADGKLSAALRAAVAQG